MRDDGIGTDPAQEYDDTDPRRASDATRDRLAAERGISRADLDAEIEEIGRRNFDTRDPWDIPPGAIKPRG